MYATKRITGLGKSLIGAFAALAIAVCAGCGGAGLGNERTWAQGAGDLPATIGDDSRADGSVAIELPDWYHGFNDELGVKTGYEPPTGKWFLHNGAGVFGYGLTTGTHASGDDYEVALYAHDDGGVRLDRDLRIRLTERTGDLAEKRLVMEQIVHVDHVTGRQTIHAGVLPEAENTLYTLSAEVLNEAGETEDALVTLIYVPIPEIRAALSTDRDVYAPGDEAVLTLHNSGPTHLVFGTPYVIEKYVDGVWRKVPLDQAFNSIGIMLASGKDYEQAVSLQGLTKGEYRVVKQFRADGLELSAELAARFAIE